MISMNIYMLAFNLLFEMFFFSADENTYIMYKNEISPGKPQNIQT